MENKITSLDRVLTTLGYNEPDKVPLFLLLSFYGAKELGMSIKDYYLNPEYVFEGQMKMIEKYKNDCLYPFFYASIEIEAFGGSTIFVENGSPNSGKPFIQSSKQILQLQTPKIENSKSLQKALQTIRMLQKEDGNNIPIISNHSYKIK